MVSASDQDPAELQIGISPALSILPELEFRVFQKSFWKTKANYDVEGFVGAVDKYQTARRIPYRTRPFFWYVYLKTEILIPVSLHSKSRHFQEGALCPQRRSRCLHRAKQIYSLEMELGGASTFSLCRKVFPHG